MDIAGWWDEVAAAWAGWWEETMAYWVSAEGQASLKDVVLPTVAIIVSIIVAVLVLAAQLSANRRQLRSELIAKVLERMAEVSVQAGNRHESRKAGTGSTDTLATAMKNFDASISALRFALPKREHSVPDFVRELVYSRYYDEDPWSILVDTDRAAQYLEGWVVGKVSARELRVYNRYRMGDIRFPGMQPLWSELKERNKAGFAEEGGPAAYERYKKTRMYKRIRRRARFRYSFHDRWRQWWWEVRNPKKAPEYREARRAMKAAED